MKDKGSRKIPKVPKNVVYKEERFAFNTDYTIKTVEVPVEDNESIQLLSKSSF